MKRKHKTLPALVCAKRRLRLDIRETNSGENVIFLSMAGVFCFVGNYPSPLPETIRDGGKNGIAPGGD